MPTYRMQFKDRVFGDWKDKIILKNKSPQEAKSIFTRLRKDNPIYAWRLQECIWETVGF